MLIVERNLVKVTHFAERIIIYQGASSGFPLILILYNKKEPLRAL